MLAFCMYNMIIESERKHPPNDNHLYDFQGPLATIDHNVPTDFADFLAMHIEIRDADAHTRLQNDLVYLFYLNCIINLFLFLLLIAF
jgi:hypothetical protein